MVEVVVQDLQDIEKYIKSYASYEMGLKNKIIIEIKEQLERLDDESRNELFHNIVLYLGNIHDSETSFKYLFSIDTKLNLLEEIRDLIKHELYFVNQRQEKYKEIKSKWWKKFV